MNLYEKYKKERESRLNGQTDYLVELINEAKVELQSVPVIIVQPQIIKEKTIKPKIQKEKVIKPPRIKRQAKEKWKRCPIANQERNKLYRERNKEKIKLKSLKYYKANKEKIKNNVIAWQKKKKEHFLMKKKQTYNRPISTVTGQLKVNARFKSKHLIEFANYVIQNKIDSINEQHLINFINSKLFNSVE